MFPCTSALFCSLVPLALDTTGWFQSGDDRRKVQVFKWNVRSDDERCLSTCENGMGKGSRYKFCCPSLGVGSLGLFNSGEASLHDHLPRRRAAEQLGGYVLQSTLGNALNGMSLGGRVLVRGALESRRFARFSGREKNRIQSNPLGTESLKPFTEGCRLLPNLRLVAANNEIKLKTPSEHNGNRAHPLSVEVDL